MKSTMNRFDYPTATSHTYKSYKDKKATEADIALQKLKYRQFDKQQRQVQRIKAQKQNQRRLEAERRENKKRLEQQLQKKKQQLQEIQKMRNLVIESEKKSHQLAILREQQLRSKKVEQDRKAKQNQFNAQNRFIEALRRLEQQKDINSKKQKQALLRRKVIQQTQRVQRGRAAKYRQQVQQKERAYKPEQKVTFNDYKQPLGRIAYNRTIDYTKTYFHNPSIIIPSYEKQQNAMQKAKKHHQKIKQISQQKKNKQFQNTKASIQRGRIAMEKLNLEKQYQQYLKQQQEKAKQYNLQRIQAGKKNQYAGVKPATLVQMEVNKKIRGQQQFQQIFFGGQNPQWFDKPMNRYNIMQYKLAETIHNTSSAQAQNSLPTRSIGSLGAVASDSHYSFQQQPIDELTSVKKQQQEFHEGNKKRVIPLPKPMNQHSTLKKDLSNSKDHEQLSYSQSENEDNQ